MIKIFSSIFHLDLERDINNFIKDSSIQIISIQYTSVCIENEICHNILIVYEYNTASS